MIKVALINDTRSHNHYGCSLVMDNLQLLLQQNGFRIEWSWPVHKDWRLHKEEILSKPRVDIVIVNGEGTINNSHRKKYAQALAEFSEFAIKNITPFCYLVNSTLYNNSSESYKYLKLYRAIFVRDQASLTELREHGCDGRWVPDLTFYGPIESGLPHTGHGVGVTDNTIRPMARKLKQYAGKNGYDYITMGLCHPRNKPFWKSPRTFVKNTWNWWFRDRYRSSEPDSFINELKQYQYIITGRFHTVTMCLKNRIPFVAIASNTPKISHLLLDVFGESSRVVAMADIESGEYPNPPGYTLEETTLIDSFVTGAQIKIESTFRAIKSDYIVNDSSSGFCYPEELKEAAGEV